MSIPRCLTFIVGLGLVGSYAQAAITITQGASAPTYSGASLTFDEPGTPTGEVAADTWISSHGITSLTDGVDLIGVNDWDPILGFDVGDGNAAGGGFGVFMNFDQSLSALSLEVWDNGGPASPFGGGTLIAAYSNGTEVASAFVGTGAWGGVGNTWWNIVATEGDSFDEIRALGFSFTPETYVDNVSWNYIPTPGAACLFGLATLVGRRRRAC